MALAVPLSWQAIGYLLFGSLIAAFAFVYFAGYARVEVVSGVIQPDRGVAMIVPTRSGVISSLAVHEGQSVDAGTELAAIRAEEDSAAGPSANAQIAAALTQQDTSLAKQIDAANAAADAQERQLAAQQSGLAGEIAQLRSQMALQQDLIASAQKDLDRARPFLEKGFVSGKEMQAREETLLSRQQGLAVLKQTLASKEAAMDEAARNAAQVAAQTRAQNANTASLRAQVSQQEASTSGARAYVLRAPIAGRVTALTARVGQPANPQGTLMTIIPIGSTLRAELAVPSAAIGFVKPHQAVHLAIDAFPYQRFGTVNGKVLTVAASAINQQGPNGTVIPVYPVTVALDVANVSAFGRQEPLVSGMTLTARIITEKQSLLQWLFEPLFAVRRR